MAARESVVEKKATVAGEGRRADANCEGLSKVAAGRLRTSIVNGFVLAIVRGGRSLAEWVVAGCRGLVCREARFLRVLVTESLRLADTR